MVTAGDFHTVLLRSDGAAVAFGWNRYAPPAVRRTAFRCRIRGHRWHRYGQTDVEPPPAGLQYTADPELHLLWRRLTWVLRRTGDAGLQRAAGALTERALRAGVFRFFLARQGR